LFVQIKAINVSQTRVFVQEEEVWESAEFDNESDKDDDDPEEKEEDNYICPLTEQQDSEEAYEDNYEMPSSTDTNPWNLSAAKPHKIDNYTDSVHDTSPEKRTFQPPQSQKHKTPAEAVSYNVAHPHPPRKELSPQSLLKAPVISHADRSKKPPLPSKREISKSKGSTIKSPELFSGKHSQHKGQKPTNHSNRTRKVIQAPAVPAQPAAFDNSKPEQSKDLDPSWYGGALTRHQAEVALRQMNKDGAFVVRDSSKGSTEHPYTLMVLKQGKVYNIRIRNNENSYSLGTDLKNKSFPGVKEMITHHTHTPLQLIDAKDCSSAAQKQCYLLHPVGF
ncbi:hypothetical protein LDENG_00226370, partial [Lucifuga dentata]